LNCDRYMCFVSVCKLNKIKRRRRKRKA